MTPEAAPAAQDTAEAARFLALLDEEADSFCFRVFDDNEARKNPALAAKHNGSLSACLPDLLAAQARGCGVYVVANAGEQTNDTIYRVRCVFADFDGAPLPPRFDLEPHAIVQSSPGKWHVYWLVDGLPTDQFRDVQRAIAARYGSDKSVNDLARVMRLPGMLHQKSSPFLVRIIHESGALPYTAAQILAEFGQAETAAAATSASAPLDATVDTGRHADVLKLTLLLAQSVRAGALTRDEAFQTMRARRDAGRWSRHVPDEEIQRALDGALQKGGHVSADETAPASAPVLAALTTAMSPLSVAEFEAAAKPHPHAFQGGHRNKVGLFPVGEVTVIGAPGREGKTSMVVSVAMSYAIGWSLAGLTPQPDRAVVIYSGEDDREQYARKLGGHYTHLSTDNAERLRTSILIPDLHDDVLGPVRDIVTVANRLPERGAIVECLVAAIHANPRVGLVIVETASTVSCAEEDNAGHRVLVSALKHVAKMTGTAVVLTHHTSQAAASKLPDLDVSEADIRGGTALVNNARQTFLPVNLGSDHDPFPEGDARALLRSLVAPGMNERVTVLICLSSSKSMDPPPVFFRWSMDDDYDPRLGEIEPPAAMRGKSWRAVRALLSGARAEARQDKKAEAGQANVRLVVKAVADITEKGEQATAAKVSAKCGRSPTWAKPHLTAAVESGDLVRSTEQVPRTIGFTDVYRLPSGAMPWQSTPDSTPPFKTSVE